MLSLSYLALVLFINMHQQWYPAKAVLSKPIWTMEHKVSQEVCTVSSIIVGYSDGIQDLDHLTTGQLCERSFWGTFWGWIYLSFV